MSQVDRNRPRRGKASESRYTFYEFDSDFPDDATCLDWLVGHLYPGGIHCPTCAEVTKHHRVKARTAYACQFCGHHEYPMKGTIFEGSATSLRLWFHAIYLMAQTRGGISAKQIERELGVTYKTAWRMAKHIRTLLDEDFDDMGGEVEADETYIGGRRRGTPPGRPGPGSHKTAVFGMVERKGRVAAVTVPNVRRARRHAAPDTPGASRDDDLHRRVEDLRLTPEAGISSPAGQSLHDGLRLGQRAREHDRGVLVVREAGHRRGSTTRSRRSTYSRTSTSTPSATTTGRTPAGCSPPSSAASRKLVRRLLDPAEHVEELGAGDSIALVLFGL